MFRLKKISINFTLFNLFFGLSIRYVYNIFSEKKIQFISTLTFTLLRRLDPNALQQKDAGPAHLINHSARNANVTPKLYKQRGEIPRLFFVANTFIAQGQELLYNYNYNKRSKGNRHEQNQ